MNVKIFEATVIDTHDKIEAYKTKLENKLKAEPNNISLQEDVNLFNRIFDQAEILKSIAQKYSRSS